MKIVAVSTVLDEPNIGRTIRHHRAQGVDQFIVSCGDQQTMMRAHAEDAIVERAQEPFDQGAEITRLAHRAAALGADWVIPFDADEDWCGVAGGTIRAALRGTDPTIDTLYPTMWLHVSPDFRAETPKPLPKVAFRPRPNMTVAWGSHNVTGVVNAAPGALCVRELQYESYTHFLAKVEKARQLHAQDHMQGSLHGTHMQRLAGMSSEELQAEWDRMMRVPVVYDPISGSETWDG